MAGKPSTATVIATWVQTASNFSRHQRDHVVEAIRKKTAEAARPVEAAKKSAKGKGSNAGK
jgi:hypothetical protein